MSQNKRPKMDLGAACSSVDGGEPHIAQQTTTTNKNEAKKIFDMITSEFREAVKWSGFVDRSLLIKELLSKTEARIVMIFAPRRFGKSMNVSMVERFFEIEEGRDVINAPQDFKELENFENFKAFNRYEMKQPCKILAEEDLVKEHFGRHPVLNLCFKGVRASSIQEVEYDVKRIVHKAYSAHSYLRDGKIFSDSSDNEDAHEVCRIWCYSSKYKGEDAIKGLQQLIKYLHTFHKRKVYLLVDEFDAPTVEALLLSKSGDEVKNISNRITKLLGAVVKEEEIQKHLLGSLITGVSYLGSVGISQEMNNVPSYTWQLDDRGRFATYYGLSQNELTTILEHVFPNQDEKRISIQNEVKELYSGYNFQNESLYCLWSVLHYIRNRSRMDASEITFWARSSIIIYMGSLLRNSDFLNDIIKIMDVTGDGYISFSPCGKVDAQVLANFLNNDESFTPYNIVLSFFMEQGYLTRDQRETVLCPNTANACVKIPNAEVLFAFEQMFADFCLKIFGLSQRKMRKCADVFRNLPRDRNDEIFKEKLSHFYNHLRHLLREFNGQEGVDKRSLQAALYTTMLKRGFEECCMEKYVTIGSRSGIIDQWLRHDNFACIIEEKFVESDNDDLCKESARQALEEILFGNKTKILEKYPNIKNSVLMGICMSSKGKSYMCCLVNSENPKDCITFPEDD